MVQRIDVFLQRVELHRHVLELLRVLESIAAIRRVYAVEVEVAASLARCLSVAFDLSAFALQT